MPLINPQNKSLKDRLNELIPNAEELKFLVGFFYFSGFKEIAENIRNSPNLSKINILVGLDVDEINSRIIEIEKNHASKTDKEIKQIFVDSFRKSFQSDECDTKEFYEQVKLFLDLFRQSKLELRKTRDPNHAKLYLFKLKNNTPDTIAIVGSSNLTRPGLSKQDELNVELREDFYLNELRTYFDTLWNNAIKFDDEFIKKEIIDTIENHSPIKAITPFEAFIYILYLYHHFNFLSGSEDSSLEAFLIRKNYKPFKYQLDAVYQAVKILEVHNGVILADVVGLGKSIIACLIAKKLKVRGLVIAPPGLIGDTTLKTSGWAKYLNDFELYDWEIFSTGKLEDALNRVQNEQFDAVIVDEVHKFRNENTDSYAYLQAICRGKKVILLTATPFNNRPSDIFAYLKLFTIPKQSTLTLNGNLQGLFKGLEMRFEYLTRILKEKDKRTKQYYSMFFPNDTQIDPQKVRKALKMLSQSIRKVIEPITIRRNRLDLQQDPVYQNEITKLPRVNPPIECFFEMDEGLNDFYDKIIEKCFSEDGLFKGPVYRPDRYKIKQNSQSNGDTPEQEKAPQRNLYDFMRRLLVKRFESSFYAFQRSIQNFLTIYQNALRFIEKTGKYILNRDVMNKILEMDISNLDEEELESLINALMDQSNGRQKEIYNLDDMKRGFLDDIYSDIRLFNAILSEFDQLQCLSNNDPKILALRKTLNGIVTTKRQKAVIFTEFVDTAQYVYDNIKGNFKVLLVIQKSGRELYEEILANFDASCPAEKQKNDYDILLVTDRFSEGYNLNRANHVINLDIPWNPVRVIQRLGRINRIGTMPFNDLFIYNFFPTKKGEDQINLRKIAETKMFTIHQCLGEDAQIFSEDEEPSPSELYQRLNKNPDDDHNQLSLITKVREILEKNYPTVLKVKHLPRYVKVAKRYDSDNMVMAVKRANMIYFFFNAGNQNPLTLEDVWKYIECEMNEPRLELSAYFWDNYDALKKIYFDFLQKGYTDQQTSGNINDNLHRAFSLITEILRKNPHWLQDDDKNFLDDLRNDMVNFGTIPQRILSQIAQWKINQQTDIISQIAELRRLLGVDYLNKIRKQTQKIKNEIIICIENQKL